MKTVCAAMESINRVAVYTNAVKRIDKVKKRPKSKPTETASEIAAREAMQKIDAAWADTERTLASVLDRKCGLGSNAPLIESAMVSKHRMMMDYLNQKKSVGITSKEIEALLTLYS